MKEQKTKDCEPECDPRKESGPVREGGGTTGAGNMSPGSASRTGGATSGVDPTIKPQKRPPVPPDA